MSIYFEKSPLNEVSLGVQFNGAMLSSTNIQQAIWEFRTEFPNVEEVPPLPAIVEDPKKPKIEQMLKSYCARKHLIHTSKNKVIQIQPDRILYNWREIDPNQKYPRFNNMLNELKNILDRIRNTLSLDLANKFNQFEQTYFDHIYLDEFNLDSYELNKVFNLFKINVPMKNINLQFSVPYSDIGGVLNTSIRSAKNNKNGRNLITLENTCRGFNGQDLENWFTISHSILIENFKEMITENAKQLWRFSEVIDV